VHDFSSGPCWTSVSFIIRNYSLTHQAGFVLKLRAPTNTETHSPINSRVLPPPYATKLNFRGSIPPSASVTVHPKLWITRPGTYGLDGWRLDAEVYENTNGNVEPKSRSAQKIRHRYTLERPVSDRTCIIVQGVS